LIVLKERKKTLYVPIASALVVALLCSCSSEESGVKLVIGDPEGLVPGTVDSLVVTCAYYGPGGELERERGQYQVEKMPQSLVVYRGKEASYGVRFWIDGLGGGRRVLAGYQSALFPSSGMRTVEVELTRDCLEQCLGEGEHCENGRCMPDASPLFPEPDAGTEGDVELEVADGDGEGEEEYDLAEDPAVEDAPEEDVEDGVEEIEPDGPGSCTPSDFVGQEMCSPGYKCAFKESEGCSPSALCDIEGTMTERQTCRATGTTDNCRAGLVCLDDGYDSRCRHFCDSDADCGGGNAGCIIRVTTTECPDGLEDVMTCTTDCDYFAQTGCLAGQACRAMIFDGAARVYSRCSHAGSGTQGSPCPNGEFDCAAGFGCFIVGEEPSTEDLCLKLCNYEGGAPTCEDGLNCSRGTDWPLPIGACL
jgi:hypothetical protein